MTIQTERIRARRMMLSLDVRRFLGPFILAGYGIFILSLFLRNVMTLYINPGYVLPTTVAGAVLVALAVVRATRPSATACADDCCADSACDCNHDSVKMRTYALLGLPLLLAALFPPRSLADFSANQRGPQVAGMTVLHGASSVKRVSLSVDTRGFSMMDWVGALSADPNPRDYSGKPVRISGVVLHAPGSVPSGYIMVIRYMVTCCIADARPVGLVVRDSSHGSLKDNQWVTVEGTMTSANNGGQKVAVVAPTRIAPTRSGNPYMY